MNLVGKTRLKLLFHDPLSQKLKISGQFNLIFFVVSIVVQNDPKRRDHFFKVVVHVYGIFVPSSFGLGREPGSFNI